MEEGTVDVKEGVVDMAESEQKNSEASDMNRPSAAEMYRRYSESGASGSSSAREPRNARTEYQMSREAARERLSRPPRPGGQHHHRSSAQAREEMDEADRNLKELEKELELQEKRDAEMLKEFQVREEQAKYEVAEKMARLDEGLQQTFDRQMLDMENRYQDHAQTVIKGWSTDVLRVNKIFREIGRGLGPDWRSVFRILVKAVPLDVVEQETKKIERQKPFMQAYKALTIARELSGAEFEIFRLVDALKECEKFDLAEHTLDILDSEGDDLFTLGSFGRGIVSGSYQVDESAEGAEAGASNGHANGPEVDPDEKKKKTLRVPGFVEGPLANRKLLQLSKKMGNKWEELAKLLEMPEDDINDIKESDGDENQNNFKCLFGWREHILDKCLEDEAVKKLKEAFKQLGRTDLADLINP